MSRIRSAIRRVRTSELGGLAGDSSYAAIWQGAISVADLLQIALITHALGLSEYGRLALAMSVVVLIGKFFDVRVGVAATTFGSRYVAAGDMRAAAGVFQFGYVIDATTGVLGFAVVAALSPLVGPALVGDDGTILILLYGLTLLVSTVDESSISILRLFNRFRLIAGYTVGLEALRVTLVAGALIVFGTLPAVLVALLLHDLLGAVANMVAATLAFRHAAGTPLRKGALRVFDEKRQMVRMVLHTNFVSYARLAQVQLPTLVLGALSTTTQVGLYKVGTAGGAIVGRLADPPYAAVLPRFSRLWASGRFEEIRRLIRSATPFVAAILGVALLLVIVFRDPILRALGGGDDALPAAPVLVLVAAAHAVNGILFWNIGLLFAAGRSGAISIVAVGGALLQLALVFPLVRTWDATGAGIALFVSLVVSNLVLTVLAVQTLRRAQRCRPQSEEITSDQRATAMSSEYEART